MTPDPEAFLAPLRRLTPREREVLHLDCQGHTAAEIAEALKIGERTVYGHLQRIYAKLGLVEERDNLRQRKLVFFCLALPHLATDEQGAAVSSPPEPPESAEPPEDEPAAPAAFERDRAAIVRWRQGELQGPAGPAPPADHPAGGADTPRPLARRAVVEPAGVRLSLARGQPFWRLLITVAVLAALLGGVITAAALSQTNRPTPIAATAATGSGRVLQRTPTTIRSVPLVSSATTPLAPTPPAAGTLAPPFPVATATAFTQYPTAAPTVLVSINPVATPLDLAGQVASDLPGTPLTLGRSVTSVIDQTTKPRDVYRLQLPAGEQLHLAVTASSPDFAVTFGPAGTLPSGEQAVTLCSILAVSARCAASLPVAASGGYLLAVAAEASGIRYTLQLSTLPLAVPPGVTDLVGRVASNIPGTPLSLGSTVFSVVDGLTKPVDVYALLLRTGQTLRVQVSASPAQEVVLLQPPGGAPFTGVPDWSAGTMLCNVVLSGGPCDQTFPIAAAGVYTLLVEGDAPGVQYTLQATAQ